MQKNVNMCKIKKILLLIALVINIIPSIAQSLSGEARSHWNKASVYIENASSENEWQMAINELEQVIKYVPEYSEAYLKLGDAYSHLSNSEAVKKAKYYWREYEKRVPSSSSEIQDKIDRMEALFEMASVRNKEKIIESLIGRWRSSKDSSKDFWKNSNDMEIFREGDKLMLRYIAYYWWYNNGNQGEPGGATEYKEIPLNSDHIIVEYEQKGEWRDKKNGEIVDRTRFDYEYKFVIKQPQVDGVIKGIKKTSSEDWNPPVENIYVYKVN